MFSLEYALLVGTLLVMLSIGLSRWLGNLGVPTLIVFMGVGMLAGVEGPGGIDFNDARLAQSVGIISLIFILFSGGLDTHWKSVRSEVRPALGLATLGVLVTAAVVGVPAAWLLDIPLVEGLLLGAIISSTDAAAVFSVLRSKSLRLKPRMQALLELESGSNDPMAVFLTIGLLELFLNPDASWGSLLLRFPLQMGFGAVFGYGAGRALVFLLNRLQASYEGLYPVFALAFCGLAYAGTTLLGGSGFLAVYVAGLVAGNAEFVFKRSLHRFFDGFAWLGQILMFLTLGLLVVPSGLATVATEGILLSLLLMLVARPLAVFATLSRSTFGWNEKTFAAWVGLRGAVPIVLATFPLLAGLDDAGLLFHQVFFIVLTSALLQGWSIPWVAAKLKVDLPAEKARKYPLAFDSVAPQENVALVEYLIPFHSAAVGRPLVELRLPEDALVVLVFRDEAFFVPSGGTVLQEGDAILVLMDKSRSADVAAVINRPRSD